MDAKTLFLSALPLPLAIRLLKNRPHGALKIRDQVTTGFHMAYHSDGGRTWQNTFWQGIPVWKCPLDLWIYQEILYDARPDVLIEAGTKNGGSAFFFASLFDLMGKGRVLTIDIKEEPGRPQHERIKYLHGSSTSNEIIQSVRALIGKNDRVTVSLDSGHFKAHVLAEMQAYAPFVTVGNYMVVEDTNLNGNPVWPEFGPGPKEAVEEFLESDSRFLRDKEREKFYLTFNRGGYLKKMNDSCR